MSWRNCSTSVRLAILSSSNFGGGAQICLLHHERRHEHSFKVIIRSAEQPFSKPTQYFRTYATDRLLSAKPHAYACPLRGYNAVQQQRRALRERKARPDRRAMAWTRSAESLSQPIRRRGRVPRELG